MGFFYEFKQEIKRCEVHYECREFIVLTDHITTLYQKSPSVCLEMIYSTDDIILDRIFFWILGDRMRRENLTISTFRKSPQNLFYLFSKASLLIFDHFVVPFETPEKLDEQIQSIRWLIQLVRKYVAQAKVLLIAEKRALNDPILLVTQDNLIIWDYALKNFPLDFSTGNFNLPYFFSLFERIFSFSGEPLFEKKNQKYYFLFRIYSNQLSKLHYEGFSMLIRWLYPP